MAISLVKATDTATMPAKVTAYQHMVRNGLYLWIPDTARRTAFLSLKIERVVLKVDGVYVADNYNDLNDGTIDIEHVSPACPFPIWKGDGGIYSANQNCETGYTLLEVNGTVTHSDLLIMAGWISARTFNDEPRTMHAINTARLQLIREYLGSRIVG